jgi:dipeptidyl aminopeptidase/acylaminoacyl peptidase
MGYDVARYLSIDRVQSPTFTVGGDLLFLSDTTGTYQVWELDDSGGWPQRRTPYEERVSFVEASPARDEFVFGMDEGGNELDQLYRYNRPEGTIHQLTAEPEASHDWGAWSPDGDRIAYAANRDGRRAFDVYVQGREETATNARRVLEGDDGWLYVATWGPDGRRLVVIEPTGGMNTELYVVDVDSGERTRLSDDTEAFYGQAHFDSRGTHLYLVTNHDAETAYVGEIDLDTGQIRAVAGDGEWPVDALSVDRRTERVVYTRNVDGYSDVHTGYFDRGEFVENTAPDVGGVIEEVAFDAEGNHYAFTWSASERPHAVFVGEFGTDLVEKWTDVGTCGIPTHTFRRPDLIRYESFDEREIPAFYTEPVDAVEGETPVIVDVHGGPEAQRRPRFYPQKQFYLSEGFAVLEPNVRGSAGYGREYTHLDDVEKRLDSVKDLKHGVQWLHDQDAVDPGRIVAYGRSYGGFMVLSAITQFPDLWAAGVDFVGIANFATFLENTGEWRRSHREAEYGSLADDRALLEDISPLHDVENIECPLFVQHGANDHRVPVEEARQIADALDDRGVPVETCIWEDEGHHTTSRENRIEEFERVAAFLDDHV